MFNAIGNSSTTSVVNTTGVAGVLHITITGTGFTAPLAPPTITTDSQISGTVTQTSPANTLTFQSYVNGAGFGAQTPTINTGSSYSSDKPGSIASLAPNFSIKETIDITLHGKSDQVNYSSSTTLQGAVPEPSSLAIAGLGALGLIGYGLRRGKAQRG